MEDRCSGDRGAGVFPDFFFSFFSYVRFVAAVSPAVQAGPGSGFSRLIFRDFNFSRVLACC